MEYRDFKGERLSALGFGMMRLPVLEDGCTVDRALTERMIDYAVGHGVNYFDTAVPYHDGFCEIIAGEILSKYPRDSYYLADKYPGHQHSAAYNPAATFEMQLKKCRTDHFDFYLMHNICENSYQVYNDPKWGILDYFLEQKRKGRIRHLGFSTHADTDMLEKILDGPYGEHMEFCQIQLNYLDWTLQKASDKCRILSRRGIPIWVMEPVRGGLLANLPQDAALRLKALRPEESCASWAFRWLKEIAGVTVILSGMSAMDQVEDNLRTFSGGRPLSKGESDVLAEIASGLYKPVPCTGCGYCRSVCPQGLDIPMFMDSFNDLSVQPSFTAMMRIEALPQEKRPSSCLKCGACARICPQKIAIPDTVSGLDGKLASMTSWAEICRRREVAQKKSEI